MMRYISDSLIAYSLHGNEWCDMVFQCHFVACCIETADKGIESALCQLVQQTVTEQNWDRPPNILQHAVTGNGIGTMKSALDVLGIVGVPTWLCLHPSGKTLYMI